MKIVYINNGGTPAPQEPEPDPGVVDQLEKMLEMAKSGRLQALFAVGYNSDGSITSGWQGAHKACFSLLGGVEQCKAEYILREFERRS